MDKHSLEAQICSFAVNIYKRLANGHDNALFSPYSVYAALLLADLGAKGITEKELRAVLGLGQLSKYELHGEFRDLRDSLKKDKVENVTLNIASRLFLSSDYDVDSSFIQDLKTYYGNEVGSLDSKESVHLLVDSINKWVEEETNGTIRDLVSENHLSHRSMMTLINAAHFKGSWNEPFPIVNTTMEDFHISKHRKKQVKMMHAVRNVRFLEDKNLDCTAVELPFLRRRLRMVFVRPNQRGGLDDLETLLTTANELRLLLRGIAQAKHRQVNVAIPRFRMEDHCNFAKILRHLGIRAMFEDGSSDFSGMLPGKPNVHVSDLVHKACIEIDETDQDGHTVIDQAPDDEEPEAPRKDFVLDRPFMFVVIEITSGTILFIGRYVQPPVEAERTCVVL